MKAVGEYVMVEELPNSAGMMGQLRYLVLSVGSLCKINVESGDMVYILPPSPGLVHPISYEDDKHNLKIGTMVHESAVLAVKEKYA